MLVSCYHSLLWHFKRKKKVILFQQSVCTHIRLNFRRLDKSAMNLQRLSERWKLQLLRKKSLYSVLLTHVLLHFF
jgi:hypothetical protein